VAGLAISLNTSSYCSWKDGELQDYDPDDLIGQAALDSFSES
jgi:hypothetical protein